jgi:multidrug efflux pump subunit AcrA (membrane-fusion protein)
MVRGVFPNEERVLSPGLMARVRVPIGEPHPALLVTDRAVESDQGQKLLYVVGEKNEVIARPVKLGDLHDGLRVIASGVKADERVIVNGLQRVRPGIVVDPKLADMPLPAANGEPPANSQAPTSAAPASEQRKQ